ncbi:hypothetical protein [Neoroseomonas lacus]|uniref:hypothetical protein n=1 Tax=Neoroseomonas lacus TaxID=287609 RepID=UPI001667F571|nr:hypothetical protein [Neoroseomonas lacus]
MEWIGSICVRGNPNADPLKIEIAPKDGFLLNVNGQGGISLLEMTVPASEVHRMRRAAPHLFPDPEPVSPLPHQKPTLRQLCELEAEFERRNTPHLLRTLENQK